MVTAPATTVNPTFAERARVGFSSELRFCTARELAALRSAGVLALRPRLEPPAVRVALLGVLAGDASGFPPGRLRLVALLLGDGRFEAPALGAFPRATDVRV